MERHFICVYVSVLTYLFFVFKNIALLINTINSSELLTWKASTSPVFEWINPTGVSKEWFFYEPLNLTNVNGWESCSVYDLGLICLSLLVSMSENTSLYDP